MHRAGLRPRRKLHTASFSGGQTRAPTDQGETMSRNRNERRTKAFEDIERLKASRRKDIIKCAASLAAILIVLSVKMYLETSGLVEVGNLAIGAVVMISAVGLAIFAGTASTDFTRCGREIEGIRARAGISKADLKSRTQR